MVRRRGSAWGRNNRREILHTLGRYLAIAGIVALGVGFFAGLKATRPAMRKTGTSYLEEAAFYDFRLISTLGMTQEDVQALDALPEVACAEGAQSVDVQAIRGGNEITLKAMSLTERVNLVSLHAGRMPEAANECIGDMHCFTEADLGTRLTVTGLSADGMLAERELTIVGLGVSPLYMSVERGTASIGGGQLNGFILLPREAFTADYFTEVYLRASGADRTLYSAAYEARIDELEPVLRAALNKRVELRYQSIIDEARQQLADAQKEYDDGAAQYARERADVKKQLAEAAQQLEDGAAELEANRASLQSGAVQLEEAKRLLAAGQAEYDAGVAALEQQRAEAYAQLDAAQAELDANRATVDAAMAQIDESGVLVQYEALLVTRRQLENALAEQTPGSAEYLLCQGLLDSTNFIISQVEQSDFFAQYQQLLDAQAQLEAGQAELDAKRAEANAQLSAAQAELDAARQRLAGGRQEIEENSRALESGWAALYEAEQQLEAGRAELEEKRSEAETGFAEAEKTLAEGRRELERASLEVEKIERPTSYLLDRETNSGYVSFATNSEIVDDVARVLPLFFLCVAAFVCITTMTRMIEEHRTQIGTLKALGYADGKIAWKYISYSGSAALLGCVLGFLAGTWLFPMVIWKAYTMLYRFAERVEYVFDWKMALISLAAALGCTVGSTWLTCRSELRQMPSNLMRPRAPKAGKRIFLEHVPILWNRFSFLYKVSIRNIMRYKKRLFMMLVGIGGCTALIATGFGVHDSIANVADDQFSDIMRYDIGVSFFVPMDEAKQERFRAAYPEMDDCVFIAESSYEARQNGAVCTVNVVATDDPDITSVLMLRHNGEDVPWPEYGAVIDETLAQTLGLKLGDELLLSVGEGRTAAVEVTGLCKNHVYHYAYLSEQSYEALFGAPCEYTAAYVTAGSDVYALGAALAEDGHVSAVSVLETLRTTVDNMMRSLDYVVLVVIISACALAFIVLYNLTNISITERFREIATIKVLGFYPRETQSYVFREILILTVVGALIGLPCGKALHAFVMAQIKIDMVSFEVRVAPLSYGLSFAITIALALLVNLFLLKKLDRIHMAESLKSVE